MFALICGTKWILLSVICMMSLLQSLVGSNSASEGFQPPLVNLDAMQFCCGLKPDMCDIFV